MRTLFVAIAAAALLAPQQPAGWDTVRGFFTAGVKQHGIVGASLAFVKAGIDGTAGFHVVNAGLLNRDIGVAVDNDTIFHWASITKTFTAVAIMQLRDRGKLKLDDPIVDYVPELTAVHNPHGSMRDITLRHLLSHSAGFRAGTFPWGGNRAWHPFEPPRWEQVAAMMPYTEVLFKPGTRYSYSNPALVFLGQVIEKVSGEPYETYVEKEILRPLGMTGAFFDRAPTFRRYKRSHSYEVRNGTLTELPFDFDTGITVSNSGLNATILEMGSWIHFLIGATDRLTREHFDGVLTRASLEEMFKPVVPVGDGGAGEQGVGEGAMGLSFFLEKHGGLDLIAHSGTQNGFLSRFYVNPARREGYIVVFNTDAKTRAFEIALRDVIVKNVWGGK